MSALPFSAIRLVGSMTLGFLLPTPTWAQSRVGAAAARCEATIESRERIQLADGSAVTIDASAMVLNGTRLLILGSPTIVWPASDSQSPAHAALLGVLRDDRGRFLPVPSPAPEGSAHFPRAVSAGRGGWHVVFGVTPPGVKEQLYLHGELWYARFDGVQWHDRQRLMTLQGAALHQTAASSLVARDGALAFAFPFQRERGLAANTPGNQGVALLQRRSDRWRSDTLRNFDAPRSVQLTLDDDGAVTALISQPYLSDRGPMIPGLLSARFHASWSTPQLLVSSERRAVSAVIVPDSAARPHATAWQRGGIGQDPAIQVGWLQRDGALVLVDSVPTVPAIDRPALVTLDSSRSILLVREGESRTRLRVFVVEGDRLRDVGVVEIPLHNFVIRAVVLPDRRVLVISGALGTRADEPPASSHLTAIAVRCPAEAAHGRR